MFLKYVLEFHLQECLKIISAEDNLGYYAIKIDFLKLFETYPEVGDKVLGNPIHFLPSCSEDLVRAQKNILTKKQYKNLISDLAYTSLKKNVTARFFGLPVCPELHRTVFPKNSDIGSFLKISGTVVRITQSKMLEYKRMYVCVKCKYEMIVEADFESSYILKAPTKCANPSPKCKCTIFNQFNLVSRIHCKDYQEIKLQEQVNKLTIGTIPGYMTAVLENDLVDSCKPGDDVTICGIVRRRWKPCSAGQRTRVELVFEANFVEVSNAKRSEVIASSPDIKDCFNDFWAKYQHLPLKGRDEILATVCPQVYGLHLVKLSILLSVITSANHDIEGDKVTKDDENYASHVREQCHLLLVGDPGTAKSQLLKAAAELTPRSVFTTGAGSTLAGLTCVALREDGVWQLEAGALVLADGGVCCIDEIAHLREHDKMAMHEAMEQQTISVAKADGVWQLEAGALVLADGGVCCIDEIAHLREHDKMAMHEAMEQQTISVAKVGIVCKLNTRCAVIAACNPRGKYQTDQPLATNVALGTPLLSRFDLIFILMDSKNKSWDSLVSKHILYGEDLTSLRNKWNVDKLQTYIGLIGPRCVQRTRSANAILQSYYMMQRQSECRDPSRTTVRMLDSLIRLSEAHCRLMYRTTIMAMDAIVAVALVDLSMQSCIVHDSPDALHTTFHKYPDFDYLCLAKKLLLKLNLYDIWQDELLYYAKLLEVDHKTLENEILHKNHKSFAKFNVGSVEDDITPSLPITSSYFNDLKEKYASDKIDDNQEIESITNHAKCESNSIIKESETPSKTKSKGRKRKEIVLQNDTIQKESKKIKKDTKTKKSNKSKENGDQELNIQNMLNEVPSVNDVFKDLGIDIKVENDMENIEDHEITENISFNNSDVNGGISNKSREEKIDLNDSISRKTLNKLKLFEFKEKSDTSNLQRESNCVETSKNNVKKLETPGSSASTSFSKPSISGSQISMFESSDCDIDLDII